MVSAVTPSAPPTWVRTLIERHGQGLAQLILRRGLSAREGFLGVEASICAFLTLPQCRQIATQPDDTWRMMTLLLGAVVQRVQMRTEDSPIPSQSGDFDPFLIRLLLLDTRSRVCETLGVDNQQREVLLSTCSREQRNLFVRLLDEPSEAVRSTRWSEEVFEQQLAHAQTPVLVHFAAEWCKPCHTLEPLLGELAEQRRKQLLVASVDVEKDPALPLRYRVRALPTLVMFRERTPIGSLVGANPMDRLVAWVDDLITDS